MSDVEFYEFRRGTVAWRYVDARKPLVYLGQTYDPAALKRSKISQTADLERNVLDITVALDLPVLAQFRPVAPISKLSLLVRVLPHGATVARGIWGGKVVQVEDNTHRAIIHAMPASAAMGTTGLRGRWSKVCRYALYGAGCLASKTDVRVDATLTGVTANTVSGAEFAGKPDGYFSGGYLEWTTVEGLTEQRAVVAHVADVLTLLTPSSVSVGTIVSAYPGCDHTMTDCNDKHDNILNYGGFPNIPPKVPFGNNPGF